MALTGLAATPAAAACAGVSEETVLVCAEVSGDPTPYFEPNFIVCGGETPCFMIQPEGHLVRPTTVYVDVDLFGDLVSAEVPIEVPMPPLWLCGTTC